MQLHLTDVSYTYPEASEPIFHQITTTFPTGWTGIIGANGCGKTTLAKLVCGLLMPEKGNLTPSLFSVYCPQGTELAPEGLEDFSVDYSTYAIELRSSLGIEDDWFWRFGTLSHGERKRLQVAIALAREPDVLVVDEPTNHLDSEACSIIADALERYPGIGILVSHDRLLLDGLVDRCLFMEAGGAVMRPGTYSEASAQSELERKASLRAREDAKRELARVSAEKAQRAEEAGRADARRSGRTLARHDSDGRERLRLAVVSGQDGRRGQISAQMDSRIAAAKLKLSSSQVEKRYTGDIWMETVPSPRKTLISVQAASLPLGEHRTLCIPGLVVGNTDHIALVGANGSGKTTLMKAMVDDIASDIRVLYIPQELAETQVRRLADHRRSLPGGVLGRVMSIVAQMGSCPDRLMEGETNSPGELRKFMIAEGMLGRPEIVLMDEPTNHMDVVSVEALQRILAACPCALVLISHDEEFVQATTSVRWSFRPNLRGGETMLCIS